MARVIASIEARMNSSRLPGKILSDIHGRPALSRMIERVRECKNIDDVVVATSDSHEDDVVELWAKENCVALYRGSEDDVLNRVVEAQRSMASDVIVELCGDCPLIDPEVIDLAVDTYFRNQCDVVTTTQVQSWPQGVDAQVFAFTLLQGVEQTINDPAVREHVSLYFYEHPEKFRIINLIAPHSCQRGGVRFQLDYEEDYRFINEVYRRLESEPGKLFHTADVLRLLDDVPELATINAHCEERSVR